MISLNLTGHQGTYTLDQEFQNIWIGKRNKDNLKVIAKKLKQKGETFHQTFEHVSKINHPAIAETIELIETKDGTYLIREYYEGTTLKHALDKKSIYRKLNERFFIQLIIELLKGLDLLHQNNILHLDIKPANILIKHNPEEDPKEWKPENVVLLDFEQSLLFPISKNQRNRFTLVYSPPEQLLNRLHLLNPSSDLSAIGIILYEVISGSAPYVDCNAEILVNLQLTYPLKKKPSMRDDFFAIIQKAANKASFPKPPRLLDNVTIESLLKQGIDGRYQNCNDLLKALAEYYTLIEDERPSWWKLLLGRLGI